MNDPLTRDKPTRPRAMDDCATTTQMPVYDLEELCDMLSARPTI